MHLNPLPFSSSPCQYRPAQAHMILLISWNCPSTSPSLAHNFWRHNLCFELLPTYTDTLPGEHKYGRESRAWRERKSRQRQFSKPGNQNCDGTLRMACTEHGSDGPRNLVIPVGIQPRLSHEKPHTPIS